MVGLAELGGFIQIPLPLRLAGPAHEVVRRFHFVKRLKSDTTGADESRGRTILIANFDGIGADLRRVYEAYGDVEYVSCGKSGPTSKGIARVVFQTADAVENVMGLHIERADEEVERVADLEEQLADGVAASAQNASAQNDDADDCDGEWQTQDAVDIEGDKTEGVGEGVGPGDTPCGLPKWLSEYFGARPGLEELQRRIDAQMAAYDARQQEEERRADAARNVPDEDGFITVSRRARRNTHTDGVVHVKAGSAASAIAAEAAATAALMKEGTVQGGLTDFYKFQVRAKREDQIDDLRKKFQQDRVRLARAREMRQYGAMSGPLTGNASLNPSHPGSRHSTQPSVGEKRKRKSNEGQVV